MNQLKWILKTIKYFRCNIYRTKCTPHTCIYLENLNMHFIYTLCHPNLSKNRCNYTEKWNQNVESTMKIYIRQKLTNLGVHFLLIIIRRQVWQVCLLSSFLRWRPSKAKEREITTFKAFLLTPYNSNKVNLICNTQMLMIHIKKSNTNISVGFTEYKSAIHELLNF